MWDVAALDRRVEHTSRAHREEERLGIGPRFQLRRRPNLVQRAPPLPSMVCESVKGGSLWPSPVRAQRAGGWMLLKGNVLGCHRPPGSAERTRNMRSTWTKLEGVAARTQRLQPWDDGDST